LGVGGSTFTGVAFEDERGDEGCLVGAEDVHDLPRYPVGVLDHRSALLVLGQQLVQAFVDVDHLVGELLGRSGPEAHQPGDEFRRRQRSNRDVDGPPQRKIRRACALRRRDQTTSGRRRATTA
jgi:hypothetical protein